MLNLNFKNKNFNLVKKFWIFVIVSAVIILAGLVDMFFIRHMNFGVEFSGGMRVQVEYETNDEEALKQAVSAYFKDAGYVVDGEPQREGASGVKMFSYRIKTQVSGDKGTVVESELEKVLDTLESEELILKTVDGYEILDVKKDNLLTLEHLEENFHKLEIQKNSLYAKLLKLVTLHN